MLLNLAGNAVKFTEDGGVGVIVGAAAERPSSRSANGPRHPGRPARNDLRRIRAGRRQRPAPSRRHRPRPRHLEADRRAHGRHARGRERRRRRLDLSLRTAARDSPPFPRRLPRSCRTSWAADPRRGRRPLRGRFSRRAPRGARGQRDAHRRCRFGHGGPRGAGFSVVIADCGFASTPREVLRRRRAPAGVGKRLVMLSALRAAQLRFAGGGGLRRLSGEAVRPRSLLRPSRRIGTRRSGDHPLAGDGRPRGAARRLTVLLAEDNPITPSSPQAAGEGRRRGHRRNRRRIGPRRRARGAGWLGPAPRRGSSSGCRMPAWTERRSSSAFEPPNGRKTSRLPGGWGRGRDGQCLLRGSVRLPRRRLRRFRAEADRPQGDRRVSGRAPAGKCRAGEGGLRQPSTSGY